MYAFVSLLISIFWALWLGGVMALFIFVKALFNQDRDLAIKTTPIIFLTFEKYHLILATVVIVLSGVWLIMRRTRLKTVMFVLFFTAGIATFISGAFVTPKIMQLRKDGMIKTPEFARMHGISALVYVGEAVAVLSAGVCLVIASRTSQPKPPAE